MEWNWEEYFGKKVDIVYDDGGTYSGYLFEHSLLEDSDIGEDSITLAPIDKMHELELPSKGIISISIDQNYIEFPREY